MRSNFDVNKIFVKLFIFESDSPVYSQPGSPSEGLERSELFNHGPLAMVNLLMIVPLKIMASP
jgi:hypothetical protein